MVRFRVFFIRKENSDEKNNGLSFRVPVEAFAEMVLPHCRNYEHNSSKVSKKDSKEGIDVPKEQSCKKCMNLGMTWSVLITSFFQAFSIPFKGSKKMVQKMSNKDGKYSCSNSLREASMLCQVM
ncbi:hypothetical protein QQ045_003943 [Rhodiola kirilowii]